MMQSFTSGEPSKCGLGDVKAELLEPVHFTDGEEPLESSVKNGKLMGSIQYVLSTYHPSI